MLVMVHDRLPFEAEEDGKRADDDKLVPLLFFLVGSIRLGLGLYHREVFGVEATIALFVALFAAVALLRPAVRR